MNWIPLVKLLSFLGFVEAELFTNMCLNFSLTHRSILWETAAFLHHFVKALIGLSPWFLVGNFFDFSFSGFSFLRTNDCLMKLKLKYSLITNPLFFSISTDWSETSLATLMLYHQDLFVWRILRIFQSKALHKLILPISPYVGTLCIRIEAIKPHVFPPFLRLRTTRGKKRILIVTIFPSVNSR